MGILDINMADTLLTVEDEYNVNVNVSGDRLDLSYRVDGWDIMDPGASRFELELKIRQAILRIPMEKFKTYNRFARVKKAIRDNMSFPRMFEKWDCKSSTQYYGSVFNWDVVNVELQLKHTNIVVRVHISAKQKNNYGYTF